MFKKVLVGCILLFSGLSTQAQTRAQWVDSVRLTLSLEEKIGQLFMLELDTASDAGRAIERQSRNFEPGSIYIKHGNAPDIKILLRELQSDAQVPLLIALQAGWGAGKSLDSIETFPLPLLVSASNNDSLVNEYAHQIAQQLKELGVSINMVSNITPATRLDRDSLYYTWGSDSDLVSERLHTFMDGLQKNGVLMCVENFPVLALTAKDNSLYKNYSSLTGQGLAGIFPSTINIPISIERQAMLDRLKVPSVLSNVVTNTHVQKKFHYNGLLFARVPEIKLNSGKIRPGEPELFAFQTGNDVLVDPQNIGQAIRKIKKSVKRNKVYQQQLEASVTKILSAKYDAGLYKNEITEFDRSSFPIFKNEIYKAAVTVVTDAINQLPIKTLDNKTFASVSIGVSENNTFNQHLSRYTAVDEFCVPLLQDSSLLNSVSSYHTVIVGVFPFAAAWQQDIVPHLKRLASKTNVIVIHFGNPSLLSAFEGFNTLIAAYTGEEAMIRIAAEQIFGALPISGGLPVSAGPFHVRQGVHIQSIDRLSTSLPEEVMMNADTLARIKDIAYEAINAGATPGCRVLVARKGKIVYDRSFGWLTYENQIPVTPETLYDLASVTKVSATLQATAFMHEKGLIDINKKMSVYLPELKGTNKEDMIIKDILTHQAGLWPFLPFWADTMKDSLYLPTYYASARTDSFPFSVSHNLFAVTAMKDSLWHWIIKSKIREKAPRTSYDYRYSDMGFYMLQHLAEKILNQPMEDFVEQNIYEPLGANTMGYLPLLKYPSNRIAPTEKDKLFRKSLLIGYVHDQGAAMHGGVAGHAGLFGTAYDLAKLGQMWLNGGTYAGTKYFDPETVNLFTRKQYELSRRGLGWDKRDFVNEAISPTSKYASANTFGHTGFTGTCIWVDPDYELVYVFLSNRVHPDMTNNKLLTMNIRTRIHDVVYRSIFSYQQKASVNSDVMKLTSP